VENITRIMITEKFLETKGMNAITAKVGESNQVAI
jgi:hypothetical protein